jgi:hypothetical protein
MTGREKRMKYETERQKPARVMPYTEISYAALTEYPQIGIEFLSGGGCFLYQDVRIVGGPDNGKRVNMWYWQRPECFIGMAEKYNGTVEEFERDYGYTSRPSMNCSAGLHISTVCYLRGLMEKAREYEMAADVDKQYEKDHEEWLKAHPEAPENQ